MSTEEFELLFQSVIPNFRVGDFESTSLVDYSKGTLMDNLEVDPSTTQLRFTQPSTLSNRPRRVTLLDTNGFEDGVLNTGRVRKGVLSTEYNFRVVDGDIIMEMISVLGAEKTAAILETQGYSPEDAMTAARNLRRIEYLFKGREVPSFLDDLEVGFRAVLSEDGKMIQFVDDSTVGGIAYSSYNPDLKSFVEIEVEGAERFGLPLNVSPINLATTVEEIEGEGISMDYSRKAFRYLPQILLESDVVLTCTYNLVDRIKSEEKVVKYSLPLTGDGFGELIPL